MSNPVKYTDLVESDTLIKIANDAKVAIEMLQEIQSLQREIAKGGTGNPVSGNPANPATGGKQNYEDLTKARQADIDSINKQNKAYKEYITVSDELKKAKKVEADAIKALASPYSALS